MNIGRKANHIYPWLLLLVISYFSLFHKLDSAPFYMWDESWYALNAQEMLENEKYLEVYLLNLPDTNNSKPPFALWCMIPFIKLFGFNELGVRLASAIFALSSAILLYLIGLKTIKNKWYALALPLVLLSSTGFVSQHIARSGDTDSILAFFILAQSVTFYAYTTRLHQPHAQWYLVATALLLSFGCLTKGIAGLLVLPGLVAWAFYTRTFSYIIKGWGFYVGLMLFTILVPGYYWYRNTLTPGYIDAVIKFELGGRLARQTYLNDTQLPFYYYFKAFVTEQRLLYWVMALPFAMYYIAKEELSGAKNLAVFFIFCLMSISILLGFSSTKLFWYDASMYPIIAAIIGLAAAILSQNKSYQWSILFLILFAPSYYHVINHNFNMKPHTTLNTFIEEIRDGEHKNDTINFIHSDTLFTVNCYVKKDLMNGGYNIITNHEDTTLSTGKYILTMKEARDIDVNNLFVLETIYRKEECAYYKIIARK